MQENNHDNLTQGNQELKELLENNSEQLNNLQVKSGSAQDFFDFVLDLLKTGLVVFIIAFILRYFVIQPYIVDGQSMMPNYENNEYLLAEKTSYMFGQPKRGDVVVFRYPKNPSLNYIKRIIGLPGETVSIKNNTVTIINIDNPNGLTLKEDYLPKTTKTEIGSGQTLTKKLNENEYFVMGDNREGSSDSREWGALPRANIAGRSWVSIAQLGNQNKKPGVYFKIHSGVQYSQNQLDELLLGFRH